MLADDWQHGDQLGRALQESHHTEGATLLHRADKHLRRRQRQAMHCSPSVCRNTFNGEPSVRKVVYGKSSRRKHRLLGVLHSEHHLATSSHTTQTLLVRPGPPGPSELLPARWSGFKEKDSGGEERRWRPDLRGRMDFTPSTRDTSMTRGRVDKLL